MSDFHDSDFYARRRIIAHRISSFFVWYCLCTGGMLLLRILFQLLHLPNNEWKPYNWVIYLVGSAFLIGLVQFDLLNRDLEKFDAAVLAKRSNQKIGTKKHPKSSSEVDLKPTRRITDFEELKQAIEDKIMSNDGTLKVTRAAFVLYCQEKDYFAPRNKKSGWEPIHLLLKDMKTGAQLEAKQFSQSYQDLGRDGKVPID